MFCCWAAWLFKGGSERVVSFEKEILLKFGGCYGGFVGLLVMSEDVVKRDDMILCFYNFLRLKVQSEKGNIGFCLF